jgi:RimJ/RimL family protein N-acetyltransferase
MIDLRIEPDGRGELSFDSGQATADDLADAAREALAEAFGSGRLRQVTWRAPVGDAVARRTAWLLGVSYEGISRSAWATAQGLVDAWTGTLVRGDDLMPQGVWVEPVLLTGDRVTLRPVTAQDEQRYLETLNDPESLRWLGTIPGMPHDSEAFRQRLRRLTGWPALGSGVEWTIADHASDLLMGTVTLFDMDGLDFKSAEVGYRTHPDARGRGLLTEALRLVIGHAFTATEHGGLGLERIHLGAGDGNEASQRVARSLGFTETGRDRRCYELDDGSVVDLVRFDLLVSEWTADRPSEGSRAAPAPVRSDP